MPDGPQGFALGYEALAGSLLFKFQYLDGNSLFIAWQNPLIMQQILQLVKMRVQSVPNLEAELENSLAAREAGSPPSHCGSSFLKGYLKEVHHSVAKGIMRCLSRISHLGLSFRLGDGVHSLNNNRTRETQAYGYTPTSIASTKFYSVHSIQ
ncbi:hypothetical protein CDL15_Pgr001903 [Punica granatum]|uniref:Uncharacterized protein n=1 Tax=Punica granatum TaxID=22663 RepID=A0A218XCB3_PUNGR|nr:hypothetical protein CDL15_Pgr001903 [Punica granatum]